MTTPSLLCLPHGKRLSNPGSLRSRNLSFTPRTLSVGWWVGTGSGGDAGSSKPCYHAFNAYSATKLADSTSGHSLLEDPCWHRIQIAKDQHAKCMKWLLRNKSHQVLRRAAVLPNRTPSSTSRACLAPIREIPPESGRVGATSWTARDICIFQSIA